MCKKLGDLEANKLAQMEETTRLKDWAEKTIVGLETELESYKEKLSTLTSAIDMLVTKKVDVNVTDEESNGSKKRPASTSPDREHQANPKRIDVMGNSIYSTISDETDTSIGQMLKSNQNFFENSSINGDSAESLSIGDNSLEEMLNECY